MATKRAKRLEKYLNHQLSWETHSETSQCPNCNTFYYNSTYEFCSRCGTKLEEDENSRKEVFDELEAAIAYALGETDIEGNKKEN